MALKGKTWSCSSENDLEKQHSRLQGCVELFTFSQASFDCYVNNYQEENVPECKVCACVPNSLLLEQLPIFSFGDIKRGIDWLWWPCMLLHLQLYTQRIGCKLIKNHFFFSAQFFEEQSEPTGCNHVDRFRQTEDVRLTLTSLLPDWRFSWWTDWRDDKHAAQQ